MNPAAVAGIGKEVVETLIATGKFYYHFLANISISLMEI
jgi:hypothetical protein